MIWSPEWGGDTQMARLAANAQAMTPELWAHMLGGFQRDPGPPREPRRALMGHGNHPHHIRAEKLG